jgi:spore germination cell wall hydrolase CwlJ-like protein
MVTNLIRIGIVLLTIILISTMYNLKAEELKRLSNGSFFSFSERERQLKCLTDNIYFEAGYESFEGKVAVAQVTVNRSENQKWPSDICDVVYQKNIVYSKVICQFSWYCEIGPRTKDINNKAYNESLIAAKQVLLEGFRLPSIKHAYYYHADYVHPQWKKPRVAKIGRHIFYGEPG